MIAAVPFTLLFGLSVGSFLNVVAYRLPRHESLSHPPSHCPACDAPVKPYDNVPVLAWMWLRGKCRACRNPISVRYPLVEAVTAALWLAVVLAKWGDAADVVRGVLLVTLLVPVTLIDLDVQRIPNALTYPFAVLGVVVAVALDTDHIAEFLIAGAAGYLFFLLAALAYPQGMGGGDVKLAGVMGLYLGRAVAPAIFIALIAGVVVGGAVMARKGVAEGRKTKVPFGPFLALGAVIAIFAGDALVDAYTGTF